MRACLGPQIRQTPRSTLSSEMSLLGCRLSCQADVRQAVEHGGAYLGFAGHGRWLPRFHAGHGKHNGQPYGYKVLGFGDTTHDGASRRA